MRQRRPIVQTEISAQPARAEEGAHLQNGGPVQRFFLENYGLHALHLPSCRLGIYLSLIILLRPGDEVIMSPLHSDSVLASIIAAGAVPVFADIDAATGNLDPRDVAASLENRPLVRAVITSNLYGCPDDLDALDEICRERGLLLLEDAVHALGGSSFKGRKVGTVGKISYFSLDKFVPAYGGAVASKDRLLIKDIRLLSGTVIEPVSAAKKVSKGVKTLLKHLLPSQIEKFRRFTQSRERLAHTYSSRAYPPFDEFTGGLTDVRKNAFMDKYLRFHKPGYREAMSPGMLYVTGKGLDGMEALAGALRKGSDYLIKNCPLEYREPHKRRSDIVYLRVPFFTRSRDKARDYLRGKGVTVDFYYDPPLNEYITNPALYADRTTRGRHGALVDWSKNIMPLNPLMAERIVDLLRKKGF